MNIKDVKKNNTMRNFFPYLVLFVIIIATFFILNLGGRKVNELTTGELLTALEKGEVTEITIMPKSSESIYYITGKLDGYAENESFEARVVEAEVSNILTLSEENEIAEYETAPDPGSSPVLYIIVNVLPLVLLIVISYILFSKLASSNKGSMDFGKSRAKLSDDKHQAKFSDVAGLKEEKEEVKELIDFLKNPKKFQKLGARIPKGVLLVGPPGTGKTLLARAVAGEANVPFFYISGSDFVELFVGVGASRVREMFKDAKRSAPCLIFIDEIDAVGRQRGTGLGGGHDEREQTLNQLLTEMDGFGENEGIIIMAATNRPDVLDPALLRPGRFDRQVTVSLPDANEREQILKVHAKNKVLDPSVDLKVLAKRTPGFTGADLRNLLNEAALLAARHNKDKITMEDIDDSIDRVVAGVEKKSKILTDEDKEITAYHEVGHALVNVLLDNSKNELHKVSIIPRGYALGITWSKPKDESVHVSKNELLCKIAITLGGRAAEEIIYGKDNITTGASADLEDVSKTARRMVMQWGMSDKLGNLTYGKSQEHTFMGRDFGHQRDYSEQVAYVVDEEVKSIVDTQYEKVIQMLSENKDVLDALSHELLDKETMDAEEFIESVQKVKERRIS